MDQLEERIRLHPGHVIRKLDNVLKRNLQLAMTGQGVDEVTAMNGWIIAYLHRNRDKNIYQKDVEAEFSIGRSAVATVIARMEEKGFIRRETDTRDARLKRLFLTEKGEKQFWMTHTTIEWINARQTEGISKEELENCFDVLAKIAQNAEQLNMELISPDRSWREQLRQKTKKTEEDL